MIFYNSEHPNECNKQFGYYKPDEQKVENI